MIRNIIYLSIILIAALFGIVNIKKCNTAFKLLTYFLCYTFLSETTAQIFSHVLKNNSLIHKIYLPIHVVFFCGIYYNLFIENSLKKICLYTLVILFAFVVLLEVINKQAILPAYGIMVEAIVLVAFSILYFYQLLINPSEKKIIQTGEFWLNSSVLFYFSGSFLFWCTFNYFFHHKLSFAPYMIMLWVLNLIHYSILSLALFLHIRKKYSPDT